jgi:hypothetical protein
MQCPDNYSQFVIHESEPERLERLHKRFEAEENKEFELPFVTVPNDYGSHQELYGGNHERRNY